MAPLSSGALDIDFLPCRLSPQCSLSPTGLLRFARNDSEKSCRCEACNDEAISLSCCVGRVAMANSTKPVALYASVGPELTHYEVDVEARALTGSATMTRC